VSIVNKFTKDISFFTKKSDILICGVGRPKVVIGSMIKKGIVVVDVGISFRKGKIIGDVDFKTVSQKAGYITPVPGGIGPLTVAFLLDNLVKLNKNNYK
jgi:methylenetetrahydrofolate dehydrogenase (NADP+)/methenyltetrahydrofolate cyclohydrolase